MKKLLSILILSVLCLALLAGCTNGTNPPAQSTDGTADSGNDLIDAGNYLFNLYKDDPTLTPSDYEVAGRVMVDGVVYTVEWTVDVTEGVTIKESSKNGFFTIDVNEKTEKEINYVLTATIKAENGETVQKTFQRTIPAYKMFSYADYAAAPDDATVVVQGIITGIFSKTNGSSGNGMYIQDLNDEGGYYVYGFADAKDPEADLGLKVGMTVSVTGLKDTYNGLYEVVSAKVDIVDSTIKTVTPVDYTEFFTKAEKLSDEALVGKQSILVTIKGVEITGQDASNGYYKFKLADKEAYVRISSSNNCISKADIETFKKNHTDNFGKSATVTGIVQLYSGNFYLIPVSVDGYSDFKVIERTDAEKIEVELGNITIPDRITENTEITLPLVGAGATDVKFAWASDNACAVLDAATGKLTITLPEADATVTLTVTVTCGKETVTKTYTLLVDSASTDLYLPVKVETPAKDTTYKFFFYQAKLGKTFYFAGYMDGYYLATTDNADKGVDVFLEAVEGKEGAYLLYFMDGETKTYIEVYERQAGEAGKGKGSVQLVTTAPTNYYTIDATTGTLFYTSPDGLNTYYLGTYNTYNTFSVSNTYYITGDKAADVGVAQFPGNFATLAPATYVPEKAETPAKDTAYKFFFHQVKLDKTFYFAGYMDGYYLATTDKADKAVDVYLEAVEGKDGAFLLYFMNGDVKTYIEVYERQAGEAGKGKGSIQLVTTAPTNYYTIDATTGALVYTAADGLNSYYLGTYSTYSTFSVSNTYYITGDKAGDVGVTQFVGNLATLKLVEVAPKTVETPTVDTAYKFFFHQVKLDKTFYFAGYMDGYYLATTEKISKAVDVFLEAVEGKEGAYLLYFMNGDVKTYIEVYERQAGEAGKGKGSVQLVTTAPTNYYTIDATTGALVYTASDGLNSYYLGTYSTYNTFSVSNTYYITGDKAGDVGVTQFVGNLATIEVVEDGPVIVPDFGADALSKELPEAYKNATIVIAGESCEANTSNIFTHKEGSNYHLYTPEGNAGASANGVIKLAQDGVFHYYIDPNAAKIKEANGGNGLAIEDCYIRWTFTVSEAGTYTICSYMRIKNSAERFCQVQFDDQVPMIMKYTVTDADVTAVNDGTQGAYLTWIGVEVELEAGEHTITYTIPEGAKVSSWHWRTIYLLKK